MHGYGDFYLLAEATQNHHEPIDGEAGKAGTSDPGKLAVRDPGSGFRLTG